MKLDQIFNYFDFEFKSNCNQFIEIDHGTELFFLISFFFFLENVSSPFNCTTPFEKYEKENLSPARSLLFHFLCLISSKLIVTSPFSRWMNRSKILGFIEFQILLWTHVNDWIDKISLFFCFFFLDFKSWLSFTF